MPDQRPRTPDPVPAGVWRAWQPLWTRRAALAGFAVPLGALVTQAAVAGPLYLASAHLAAWRGVTVFDPRLPLDAALPFVPWTIALYLTHFAYHPLVAGLARGSEQRLAALLRLVQAQGLVLALTLPCFLLFPARVDLRDGLASALAGEAPWIRAGYRFLHTTDPPWNAWPSLHISQTLLPAVLLHRWAGSLRAVTMARGLLWLLWGGLAISILTTKQHFLFDGLAGAAVGVLAARRLA